MDDQKIIKEYMAHLKSFKENGCLDAEAIKAASLVMGYSEDEASAITKLACLPDTNDIFVSNVIDVILAKQKYPELDLVGIATNGINDLGCYWFCDNCFELLNYQPGFDCSKETWKCRVCGHINDVTEDTVLDIKFKKDS